MKKRGVSSISPYLWVGLIIAGLVLGKQVEFLERIGKAFIDLLKMLVGLIVFSSLVTGMCHINDPKKLGRIGLANANTGP